MNIRKKIRVLAYWICLFSLTTSCIKEHETAGVDENIQRGNHYLSFQLKTGPDFIASRATGLHSGTEEEQAVSSVHILLYEATGENSRLLYNIPIQAQTNGSENFHGQDVANGNQSQFTSTPIALKKQDYQLITLINPTTAILAQKARSEEDHGTACNTLKDMLSAIQATSANQYHNQGTHFFMSNAGGVIYISESQLQPKSENALLHPIAIPVERLVAKISLHNDLTSNETTLGGKIGEITWGIDITNKSTYLIRQAGHLSTGQQETGFHANRKQIYAKDPNFDNNNEFLTNKEKRKEQFNILSIKDNASFIKCNTSKNDHNWYQYILENTMSQTDQNNDTNTLKAYTTQVVIKIIITEPRGMTGVTNYYSFYDDTEPDPDKKNKIFTHVQAVEWYNGTFPSDMIALKEILHKAQEMQDSPFNFLKGQDQEPGEYTTTPFRLTYHKDGLNIYRIPVQHFGTNDTNTSEQDYGYYGVVRNNTYQLLIKSIKGTGVDSSDEGYLSTNIILNPWFAREGEEDLKPGISY